MAVELRARDRELQAFSAALDAYPAAFRGNPLNLLLLDDVEPIASAVEYLNRLDSPYLVSEQREYYAAEDSSWPFPCHNIESRPSPRLVSDALFARFDLASKMLPTQRSIGHLVEQHACRGRPSTIAVVIVDGLSYYDLPEGYEAQPCLVDGVTTTEHGYQAVVGHPSLARRVFALGYTHQLAYSYYPTETDALSAAVHLSFSASQVSRVKAFDEVLSNLRTQGDRHGQYVQVTLSGLDQISHAHHDRPPKAHYLQEVLRRFDELVDCLSRGGRTVLAYMVADHGILWRDEVEDELQVADDLFQEDVRSARYVKGSLLRAYGRTCRSLGQNYTLLGYPWMTRRFRNNEWGVHGGISAWESIVPLIIRQT